MPIKLKNNVSSTLASAISASDVGLTVAAGTGALFPALTTGDYFYATVTSAGGTQEIVKVTARVSDAMTIARAQDGTTAQSFAIGSRIELRVTAAAVTDFSASGTGAVVRVIGDKLRESVSPEDFGAVGNGTADDTTALQNALNTGATVRGVGNKVYRITAPLTVTVAGTQFIGAGCEVRQITSGNPAFVVSVNDVVIQDTRIVNGTSKPNSNSPGPYLSGVPYHSGVLQISGDYLTVKDCVFIDWTAGVGFHGAQDNVTLSKGLRLIGNMFTRHDQGMLIQQFDGALVANNIGFDGEETAGEPTHLLYVTDRSSTSSRGLTVVGNVEENNTSSDAIKIRNVTGFSITGNVARGCVRGISVGFSENGVVSGNAVSDLLLRVTDTQQTGINIDDSRNINLCNNTLDIGAVGASGIRIRSDLGTFGNTNIFSSGNIIYYDGTASAQTAYRITSQTDFTSSNDAFVNTGTNTNRYPFRVFTSTRVKIINPVLLSSPSITNAARLLDVDAGNTDTSLFVNDIAWPSWSLSASLADAGTNTVVKATDEVKVTVGSESAPSITFEGDPNTGLYRAAPDVLTATAGGTGVCSFLGNRLQPLQSIWPSTDNALTLGTASLRWQVLHIYNVRTHGVTVAGLAALTGVAAGARAFVTDANSTTFGAVVAGGGANQVPVYNDGTNWRIG